MVSVNVHDDIAKLHPDALCKLSSELRKHCVLFSFFFSAWSEKMHVERRFYNTATLVNHESVATSQVAINK